MSDGKIKVTIDGLGRPKIEAVGFVGQSCTDATRGIEQALQSGAGDAVRVYKPEFNQVETEEATVQQTTGW